MLHNYKYFTTDNFKLRLLYAINYHRHLFDLLKCNFSYQFFDKEVAKQKIVALDFIVENIKHRFLLNQIYYKINEKLLSNLVSNSSEYKIVFNSIKMN